MLVFWICLKSEVKVLAGATVISGFNEGRVSSKLTRVVVGRFQLLLSCGGSLPIFLGYTDISNMAPGFIKVSKTWQQAEESARKTDASVSML